MFRNVEYVEFYSSNYLYSKKMITLYISYLEIKYKINNMYRCIKCNTYIQVYTIILYLDYINFREYK